MFGSCDSRARRGAGWPATALSEPVLATGDLVGVCSPAFAVRPGSLNAGLEWLSGAGFVLRMGRHVTARDGYLAGTDRQRGDDLRGLLEDSEVRGVWFARGGYGSARLLEDLPWRAFARDPKPLVGYSDVTALFAAALRSPGTLCLHGPVVTELADPQAYDRAALRRILAGRSDVVRFSRSAIVRPGRARGRLLGGNLTVLTHLLGTRWLPKLEGAVLALEDTGEETYRLDRMFEHLRHAGVLRRVAAVVLGGFHPPHRKTFPPDREFGEVVMDAFGPLGVPVVRDLPFGHVLHKRTLPLGGLAELDTDARSLRVTPCPVG